MDQGQKESRRPPFPSIALKAALAEGGAGVRGPVIAIRRSALPEMYEALKLCSRLFGDVTAGDYPGVANVRAAVDAALAKAEGREP